ncbi:hypothetical protein M409DRAFT_29368 [Zasmidium cellare ATCC 36951]|uniref:Uncharacterized protein n=1 Tax=Zasmidium cellare ATCC 36951 TaxID=1080233 RepID=A0A6A6C3F8_ZASCE|nr:uncharacterized protein M409DRAFT_29368 [Zasmidium cellare ATCC 36951]KAF2160279.1 hypothetical protein M409DRAFT_29368 [Zasmidium cellare ATCC 36951]
MDEDHSDKENLAPPTTDVPYPAPPLPLNSKGNIFKKQLAIDTHYEHHASPAKTSSNLARKRQKLGALSNTPPRPSYASQMSKIFAGRTATKNEVPTPPGIPEDAMKVFNHFKQALRCESSREEIGSREQGKDDDDGTSDSSSASDAHSSSGETADYKNHLRTGSGQSTIPLLQQDPPTRAVDSDPFAGPSPSSHNSLSSISETTLAELKAATARSWPSSPLPTNALERAIHASFPPTPSREERRRTLNIDLRNTPPPPPPPCVEAEPKSASSSTESWTGDELFFPRLQTQNQNQQTSPISVCVPSPARTTAPSPSPTSPLASPWAPSSTTTPNSTSRPSVRFFSPLRAIRPKNRFHVPVVRSPMGQGVPLCMEDHPESGGSDADDEDEDGASGREVSD